MRKLHNILVTGGAGFIGCNFIHYLFGLSNSGTALFNDADFDGVVVNVDALTYAGNLESLKDVEEKFGGKRYFFEKVDICDRGNLPLKQKIPIYKESEFKSVKRFVNSYENKEDTFSVEKRMAHLADDFYKMINS